VRWFVPSFAVDWNVGAKKDTWRGKRFLPSQEGQVVDISVSGASILAPSDTNLQQGSRVVVGFERERSMVAIRRISDTGGDDGRSLYGVEFIDAPAHMVSNLMERATGTDNDAMEHRWNRSV
jgi:hypothetical protein